MVEIYREIVSNAPGDETPEVTFHTRRGDALLSAKARAEILPTFAEVAVEHLDVSTTKADLVDWLNVAWMARGCAGGTLVKTFRGERIPMDLDDLPNPPKAEEVERIGEFEEEPKAYGAQVLLTRTVMRTLVSEEPHLLPSCGHFIAAAPRGSEIYELRSPEEAASFSLGIDRLIEKLAQRSPPDRRVAAVRKNRTSIRADIKQANAKLAASS